MEIANAFSNIQVNLSDLQIEQLNKYYELLVEKNKVMNLTTIVDYDDVIIKHFLDSALICKAVDIDNVNTVIDVGTGAGFPGLVLKIVFPKLKVTLLDSLNKRIKFLDEVIECLNLEDIETIHSRAEDAGMNDLYREKFDMCVSRAVANLSSLSEYCIPFIKRNGYFVSYKADGCDEEINSSKRAITILGCEIENVVDVNLPETDIARKFILIHKITNTSKKYPRKAGLPTKEPLN